MSNGTVPGSSQPVTFTPPDTGMPYMEPAPASVPAPESSPQEPAAPQIDPSIQQELTELRSLRDNVAPLMPLVNELGGEGLYQHYAQYATMLQERQRQPEPTAPEPTPSADPWADTSQPDPVVARLESEISALKGQLGQVTRNVGVDKVAAHSEKFFRDEYPDLTPEERKRINDGMGRVFQGYAESAQGQAFLQNPQYEAVRALAINQMPREMIEEVYRRKFERERTSRSRLSTDTYRPSQPANEDVDMGDDFLSAWEGSAEKVRRETGGL
jgi:hypothetical protein